MECESDSVEGPSAATLELVISIPLVLEAAQSEAIPEWADAAHARAEPDRPREPAEAGDAGNGRGARPAVRRWHGTGAGARPAAVGHRRASLHHRLHALDDLPRRAVRQCRPRSGWLSVRRRHQRFPAWLPEGRGAGVLYGPGRRGRLVHRWLLHHGW